MSADVNEVCRLLEDLDIDHEVAQNGHEVRWRDADGVRWAFFGIRAGVLALLVKALVSMYRQCPKSLTAYLLMAAAFAGAAILKISAPVVIACCAALGLGVYWLAGREKNP